MKKKNRERNVMSSTFVLQLVYTRNSRVLALLAKTAYVHTYIYTYIHSRTASLHFIARCQQTTTSIVTELIKLRRTTELKSPYRTIHHCYTHIYTVTHEPTTNIQFTICNTTLNHEYINCCFRHMNESKCYEIICT